MAAEEHLTVEERILQLLQHLGIQKAHFAACEPQDYASLVTNHPEVIASLTLACPRLPDARVLGPITDRLLVITGDRGTGAETLSKVTESLEGATLAKLPGFSGITWDDPMRVKGTEALNAITEFLRNIDQPEVLDVSSDDEGEVAGITYRAVGTGAPLVLLPLGLAASQWDPVIPALSRHYRTITLSGAYLGSVAGLDRRGQLPGLLRVFRTLVEEVELQPGERVLDVGCGTVVLDRWLARRTGGVNPITAVDISHYMLREAAAFAKNEGLEDTIHFQEGNAESLPFADSSFDVVISCTVIGECNADKMLSEMVRVARPGGRIGVMVQAFDMHSPVNVSLPADIKAKVEALGGGQVSEGGCADVSLYHRFVKAELDDVRMCPQLATFQNPSPLFPGPLNTRLATLNPEELRKWDEAVTKARSEGTFFTTLQFHCAVGTKS